MNHSAPLIAAIGEVLWDKFPDANRLGGAPANFVFHAEKLGAKARIVSRIGRNPDGDRLVGELRDHGISTEYLQIDPFRPTGTVVPQRNPIFFHDKSAALDGRDAFGLPSRAKS